MEANQQVAAGATQDTGISNTTIFLGTAFILTLAAVGYYLIEKNKTVAAVVPPNYNQPIPGYQPQPTQNGGAKAMGVLTDPNFFGGLTNFAKTIADIVEKNKGSKATGGGSKKETAPPVTGGGSVELTGIQPSNNWGSWG